MFQDFRQREDGATIETDICVVGGGAAGITLALELAGSQRGVCLVESGGLEPDPDTLALNNGEIVGLPYPPLQVVRLRYFGGTTNHWGGHCRPLDPIDFTKRPWIPHSGWPIDREELEPFYRRAQLICELGPYEYHTDAWRAGLPGVFDFAPQRLQSRPWLVSTPTRFGERYRDDLGRASNVEVLLNANVTEIVASDDARRVVAVRLKTLGGKTGIVRAKVVVLAGGGIENPRLLLASNRVMTAGLGNGRDLVGRFFLEHPSAMIGFAVASEDIQRWIGYFRYVPVTIPAGKGGVRLSPMLSEALQHEKQLLNCAITLGSGYDRSAGYLALRDAGKRLGRGELSGELGDSVLAVLGDLDGAAEGVYRRITGEQVLWFCTNVEQAPNPDSRVTLSNERDALGSPQARLDWRLTSLEKRTTRFACRLLGEELARLGIARMRIDPWLLADDTSWPDIDIRYHQMGTTRMSSDAAQGVVDANCRVHGIENLYVAGSSVFPTGGCANPTLTIVALAVRLADHLKQDHA